MNNYIIKYNVCGLFVLAFTRYFIYGQMVDVAVLAVCAAFAGFLATKDFERKHEQLLKDITEFKSNCDAQLKASNENVKLLENKISEVKSALNINKLNMNTGLPGSQYVIKR